MSDGGNGSAPVLEVEDIRSNQQVIEAYLGKQGGNA